MWRGRRRGSRLREPRHARRRAQTIRAGRPFPRRGIAYCVGHDLASYGLYLRVWRARQALNSGHSHAAGEEVSELLAHPEASPPTQIVAHIVAGLLAARTGDHARARRLLGLANAFAAPTGELLGELSLWRQRAGLKSPDGDTASPFADELAGDWRHAAALWTDLGCPYEAALALAGSDSEPELRRALTELQRLGARRRPRSPPDACSNAASALCRADHTWRRGATPAP